MMQNDAKWDTFLLTSSHFSSIVILADKGE